VRFLRLAGFGIIILALLAGCNLNFFPEPPEAIRTPVTPFLPPTMTPVLAATGTAQTVVATSTSIPVVSDTPAPIIPTKTPLFPTQTLALPSSTFTPQPPTAIPTTPVPIATTPSGSIEGPHVGQGMGGLRLRQFPDSERGTIMLTLKEFTPLEIQGRTADSAWLLVKIPEGFTGWVSSQFVVNLNLNAVAVIESPQPVPFVGPTAPPDAPAVTGNITGGARNIYLRGQSMGNRRNVFTTIGDSITDTPYFLRQFPLSFQMGEFGYLLPTLQYFMAVNDLPGTSFDHLSLSTRQGWSTLHLLDQTTANSVQCQQGEIPIACELRVRKASVVLVLIGTNDVPIASAEDYRPRLQRIIELCIEQGVVPVLSTLPPRRDAPERVAQYNEVIKQTALRYDIPLWDLYAALIVLPNQGLDPDGVHLSIPPGAPASTTDFSPGNLQYGTVIRNLTALQTLDVLLKQVMN
jgi:hypothetical protein